MLLVGRGGSFASRRCRTAGASIRTDPFVKMQQEHHPQTLHAARAAGVMKGTRNTYRAWFIVGVPLYRRRSQIVNWAQRIGGCRWRGRWRDERGEPRG
jgi:hypothetical protein